MTDTQRQNGASASSERGDLTDPALYFPQFSLTQEQINQLFTGRRGISNSEETILWNRHLDDYEAAIAELVQRDNGLLLAFQMIIRWETLPRSSPDYQRVYQILRSVRTRLGQDTSETIVMSLYKQTCLVTLDNQISLDLEYHRLKNILDRKKYDYALEFRHMRRFDIHPGERFGSQDVLNHLSSLVANIRVFERNIIGMQLTATTHPDKTFIADATTRMITLYRTHIDELREEITHYESICEALGASGYRK